MDKAAQYETKAAALLHKANVAAEKGDSDKAERLYTQAQTWLDKMNAALGNN